MAKQQMQSLTPMQREFEKHFRSLCTSASPWQVWNDFVDSSAIAISNAAEIRDEVKKERESYFDTIQSRYGDTEDLAALLGITFNALEENQEQDFLGDLFMRLDLGSNWHGQFFTPYHVSLMTARLCTDGLEKVGDYYRAADPACGAGALLIAVRNLMQQKGYGSEDVFFVAQDISHVAGMMCYIQLSLLGCAGYVCVADTLMNPITASQTMLWPDQKEGQDFWFTPIWYSDAWQIRIFGEMMKSGRSGGHREHSAERHAEKRSDPPGHDVVLDVGEPEAAEEDPGQPGGGPARVHDQQGGDGALD